MEEHLTKPLPTLSDVQEEVLPIDYDQKTLESGLANVGTLASPTNGDDTATTIQWQAAHLLNKIDPDVLRGLPSKLPGASSKIGDIPIIKSYMNLLLLLTEEDSGKQWITRIPYDQEDRRFLIDQVEPLLRVRMRYHGFRVPKLYQHGLARDEQNMLGIDYMLLDFIDGEQMSLWTESYPAWEHKEQILGQLADIYVEIFAKPASYEDRLQIRNANCIDGTDWEDFDAYDLPPTMTASLYLYCQVDKAIRGKFQRLLASSTMIGTSTQHMTTEDRLTDLLILLLMRAIIPTQIVGKYNDAPFYITHPDLHNRNIIINKKPNRGAESRTVRASDYHESTHTVSSPAASQETTKTVLHNQERQEPIKITGVIDWDAAHPIPLQCAAIYPKFLETLPGAEFPDLPADYKAPDLSSEKNVFLSLFGGKELAATGDQMVTDLIRCGSWERDFFTIALTRGDVRSKWFQHWLAQQPSNVCANVDQKHDFSLGDTKNLWNGLWGFLSHEANRSAVTKCEGWELVARVVLQLEQYEKIASERLCTQSSEFCR